MPNKKQTDYYSRWYAEHRNERNLRRREKYHDDEDYRKREIERRVEYDKRKGKPLPKNQRGRIFRSFKGAEAEVWRIGEVADWCESSAQIIRKYEQQGLIPRPLLSGVHRLYTARQCDLIAEVVDFMRAHRWAWQHKGKEAKVKRDLMSLKKRVTKEWGRL